jgi:DNA-binding XRE family transcriptional regulator
MKGKEFKLAIAIDGRQKQEIAKLLGISRQKLNDLEKVEEVPSEIIEGAKKIGIKFPSVTTNVNVAPVMTEIEFLRELTMSQQKTIFNLSKVLSSQKSETV